MGTQALVIGAVLATLALWSASPPGRAAWALLRRAPRVLFVAPLVWVAVSYLNEADLGAFDEPFLVVGSVPFAISATLLLLGAVHIAASAIVFGTLARAAGRERASAWHVVPGLLLGHALLWSAMIGGVHLALPVLAGAARPSGVVMGGTLALFAAGLVTLNVLLMRLLLRLLAEGGRWSTALLRPSPAQRAGERRLFASMAVRLLVTGAFVVVWISGHTTVTTTTTRTLSTYRFLLDGQTAASVACDSPWVHKISESLEVDPPRALELGLGLLTSLLSILFLAGFVAPLAKTEGGRDSWP